MGHERAVDAMREVLESLGWTVDGELSRTPERFVELLSTFADGRPTPEVGVMPASCSGPVRLERLQFQSLCVHHLVPFFGHADIEYIPDQHIAGLSAISRVVKHVAGHLQLQEQMSEEIADILESALRPKALRVTVVARQMCLEMRGGGVDVPVTSTALRGGFRLSS